MHWHRQKWKSPNHIWQLLHCVTTVCVIRQVLHECRHTHTTLPIRMSVRLFLSRITGWLQNRSCTDWLVLRWIAQADTFCTMDSDRATWRSLALLIADCCIRHRLCRSFAKLPDSISLKSPFLCCLLSLDPTDSFKLLTVCSTFALCYWNVFVNLNEML